MLYLEETVNGTYTGRKPSPMEIKYIFLEEGHCIVCW